MANTLRVRQNENEPLDEITQLNPLPVAIPDGAFVSTRTDEVERVLRVTGIGYAAAYAANDTFGSLFEIPGVARLAGSTFVILKSVFYDYDNEGINKTLHLFSRPVTLAADNAAWALADTDTRFWIGKISFSSWDSHTNGQTSLASPALYLKCGAGTTSIWGAFQTSGADNIATTANPEVCLLVARD